jgi:hypothetical protein
MKPMRHPFRTDMPHMCYAWEIEGPELSIFWTASEWATKCGIRDEP